jgi:rhodanese-related sulfurtransferase
MLEPKVSGMLVIWRRAIHLPLDIFEQNIASLVEDKQQIVYLYCRSGNRSGKALQIMQGPRICQC